MRKTLTFSLSLAAAFSVCSLSLAGHHNNAVPSAQCEAPSAQCAAPSAQSEGCGETCGPVKKKCHLFDMFKHKPKCYTYEWVLKKKKVKHHKGGGCGGEGCGAPACESCGVSYPSSQGVPSSQGYGSGQYLSPTAQYAPTQYAPAGQATGVEPPPAPEAAPAPAPAAAPAAPPAPAPTTPPAPSANAGGLLYLSPAGN